MEKTSMSILILQTDYWLHQESINQYQYPFSKLWQDLSLFVQVSGQDSVAVGLLLGTK